MSEAIRTLVVDDEYHARRGMRALMEHEQGVEIVGEAADGKEAIERIRDLNPDVVFLDIAMPGCNGFEVVAGLPAGNLPHVVFVTAFDKFAVRAFEASAVDYVLKPFSEARLRGAMDKVRTEIGRGDASELAERLRRLLASTAVDDGRLERFGIKIGDRLEVFGVEQIDWIEAEDCYVKLHIGGRSHLVRQSLNSLESQLPSSTFARIHRSTIVNLDRVVALEPLFRGECSVVLGDGTRLRTSRRRRGALAGRIKTFN